MKNRVVVTGMGIVAPNAIGLSDFSTALKVGQSGITFHQELADLNFSCQVGGVPPVTQEIKESYFTQLQLRGLNSSGIVHGYIAGIEAWKDAGLELGGEEPDWDTGVVFGAGLLGADKFREALYKVDEGNVRRLGSTVVTQIMTSGISAMLSGAFGAANQVSTNSSACSTGTEAILIATERIRSGRAKRILAGSCSEHGPYVWGGFDAMRVMTYKHNQNPEQASRPMSETASGFVPGSGAGAMVLESLESALERGASIYAEVIGGHVNSGGQRQGGTMTAPNSIAVQRCITQAIEDADIQTTEIDVINGHLTATAKDPIEIANWAAALQLNGENFPYINSTKSLVGHCLAASGSIESVAAVLQISEDYIHPSVNATDLHPEISKLIDPTRIPQQTIYQEVNIVAKASFGFGDVNACVIFKKYQP